MILLTLLTLTNLPAHAEPAKPQMSCTAIYRTLDKNNNTLERTAEMPVKGSLAGQWKHEAEMEGKFFALTEEASGDLFAQITTAPDCTKGLVFRGAADSLGRFNATEVVGYTIYRMECSRLRN